MPGAEFGRISGPLLARNLQRNGIDLAFENDLLYLKVSPRVQGSSPIEDGDPNYTNPLSTSTPTSGIGINTDVPVRDLEVSTTFRSTNLTATTSLDVGIEYVINTNTIQNVVDKIYIQPNQATDPKILATKFGTLNLRISDQLIENITNNSDINLSPNGTGTTIFNTSEVYITGDLHSTGDITWDGDITFGNNDSDSVDFKADINSDIIPNIDNTYNLGTNLKRWNKLYTTDLISDSLTFNTATVNGIDLLLDQGNTLYVSVNGSDSYVGTHLHNTYRTIKKALSVAVAGDTVVVFPGVYDEIFPLTVPAGVTVNGAGIRAVTIKPTLDTTDKDAFLLNGETTVSHLSVIDFEYNITTNLGYAFRLAPSTTVTSRSPYVQNCTVIPKQIESSAITPSSTDDFQGPVKSIGNYIFYIKSAPTARIEIYDISNNTLVRTINTPFGRNIITTFDVDDTRLIMGCRTSYTSGVGYRGAAYVYEWATGTLVRTFLDPRGTPSTFASDRNYGAVVSISGNRCSVSDTGYTVGGYQYQGRVYVYNITTGATTYTIDNPNISTTYYTYFGGVLEMGPTYLAIKHNNPAYFNGGSTNYGRVYVYNLTTGLLHKTLNRGLYTAVPAEGHNFGASISIDETSNKIAIGSPNFGDLFNNESTRGGFEIFTLSGTSTTAITQYVDPNAEGYPRGDLFGYSLNLKGNTLIVGAPGESPEGSLATDFGTNSGVVYVFDVSVNNAPVLIRTIYNPNAYSSSTSDFFGDSVTITDSAYVVYASGEDTATISNSGTIYTIPKTYTGRGALIDGSVVNSSSKEATILFHSVTMIVPDSIGVHATNGARVEWLDCFTYFAEKGIYLTEGSLGFASLGVKFGAEIRSIGSANVYGTYGAVADGANTLAYLISHNFAYIGTGTDSSNDPKLVIQANEVVESNSGRIYYESVDHKGDFRIGDIFYVNQDTGAVVFDAQSIVFTPTGSITLEGPTSSAYIDYSMVQVGNIRIHDNNIDSLTGPVNFLANSGNTYLNTNVFVTGNTTVSADINVDGNIWLGDTPYDTITVYPQITQDLLPDNVGGPFTLGTDPKRWNTLYGTLVNIDGTTQITNNTISTLTSGTNLVFSAAGTGIISITNTDVDITNNLTVGNTFTVNGISNFQDVEITGNILQTGNWGQTGDAYIIGTFANNNIEITGASYFEVPNIKLFNNEISATATNDNLNFVGLGAGGVVIDQRLKFKDSTISNVWSSPTNNTQKSIIFDPNGTGNVVIDSTKSLVVPVGNSGTASLTLGDIRYNNLTNLYEGGGTAGLISFNGIYDSNRSTGVVAGTIDNTLYFNISGIEKTRIDSTALQAPLYYIDNVSLSGNTINNIISGNDLTFAPNGTGNTMINGIGISDGKITNFTNNSLNLVPTGAGYFSFAVASAIMIPMGDSAERRLTPEIGETRFNTEKDYMEVYTGDINQGENGWVAAIGEASGIVDANVVTGLLDFWTLILG